MNTTAAAAAAAGGDGGSGGGLRVGGCCTLFTASQWQELEQQALIFKYMMSGTPVPPDLLIPIRKSFDAMAARLYHHPTVGYCSLYGKKLDPEPGRCRRTDGKKWRCSKDAHPDSRYCERHMHRGRNRSRKPVESQTLTQTQQSLSPSSTVTSLTPAGSGTNGGLQKSNIIQSSVDNQGSFSRPITSHLQMGTSSYTALGDKDYRYTYGVKADDDEPSFFSGASWNARGLSIDSSLDNTWSLMPNQMSSHSLSKGRSGSMLQNGYTHLEPLPELGLESISSLSRQQQHCFFGNDFSLSEVPKQESQSLRPFFDEWPKARDSWSELEDERSNGNHTLFSTTELSISIPMTSSDFSTTSSRSPNDD